MVLAQSCWHTDDSTVQAKNWRTNDRYICHISASWSFLGCKNTGKKDDDGDNYYVSHSAVSPPLGVCCQTESTEVSPSYPLLCSAAVSRPPGCPVLCHALHVHAAQLCRAEPTQLCRAVLELDTKQLDTRTCK